MAVLSWIEPSAQIARARSSTQSLCRSLAIVTTSPGWWLYAWSTRLMTTPTDRKQSSGSPVAVGRAATSRSAVGEAGGSVAVGGTGVAVGGAGVAVGGCGVAVGTSGMDVTGSGVADGIAG